MSAKSILIKDTTKEERIALIKEWIPDDDGCSDDGGIDLWDMYDAYIKGEKEIAQINKVNFINLRNFFYIIYFFILHDAYKSFAH